MLTRRMAIMVVCKVLSLAADSGLSALLMLCASLRGTYSFAPAVCLPQSPCLRLRCAKTSARTCEQQVSQEPGASKNFAFLCGL